MTSGDHGTSVSDKINLKTLVIEFVPTSFRPLEGEIGAFKSFLVGGWVGHLIIVSLQVLPFEFLTLNVEY